MPVRSSLLALLALASLARGVAASSKARTAAAADARLSAADADALLTAAAAAANAAAATEDSAAGADTSAANPFSRAGLQGRRAKLFAEERAKHVAIAAKFAVQVVLDAAFFGESNVTISNVADATPTPPAPNEIHGYNGGRLLQMPEFYRSNRKQWQSGQNDRNSEPEMLRRTSQRLMAELDQLSRYEDSGVPRDEMEGGITLTPKVAREMADEKRRELDVVQTRLRRLDRVEAHERAGFIARSCLDDVARAVAAELPGVSVEVQGASEGLYISWE